MGDGFEDHWLGKLCGAIAVLSLLVWVGLMVFASVNGGFVKSPPDTTNGDIISIVVEGEVICKIWPSQMAQCCAGDD